MKIVPVCTGIEIPVDVDECLAGDYLCLRMEYLRGRSLDFAVLYWVEAS